MLLTLNDGGNHCSSLLYHFLQKDQNQFYCYSKLILLLKFYYQKIQLTFLLKKSHQTLQLLIPHLFCHQILLSFLILQYFITNNKHQETQRIVSMDQHLKIKYKEYKNTLQQAQTPTNSPNISHQHIKQLQQQLTQYERKYLHMKSINESLISAIQRVFSNQLGQELIQIISAQQQHILEHQKIAYYQHNLTDTFSEIIKIHNHQHLQSSFPSRTSFRYGTPTKIFADNQPITNKQSSKSILSPFVAKSHRKKSVFEESSIKLDSGQISTRRSRTPVKSSIATQIYCELCQKVFAPNEFVNHTQKCKYQLQYVENDESKQMNRSKFLKIDYQKMMRNLLKIKEEIQNQIEIIAESKEQINKASLKKKLQKDLKKIIQVINQKQDELKTKRDFPGGIKSHASKKVHKLR